MKNKIMMTLFVLIIILTPYNVDALRGEAYNLRVRTCPATNNDICPSVKNEEGNSITINGEVEVFEKVASISPDDDECIGKEWYRIIYDEQDRYICAGKVTILEEKTTDTEENNSNTENNNDNQEANNEENNNNTYNNNENSNTNENSNNNNDENNNENNNENNDPQNEEPPAEHEPEPLNTIPSKYDVIAYATHPSEGRVPIVSLKQDMEDSFTCDKTIIVINNNLTCVDNNILYNHAEVDVLDTNTIPYNYEEELAKFPESYQVLIRQIHNDHPTWRFYAYLTNLDWNEVIAREKNSCLIQRGIRDDSFCDTEELANYNWRTNTFTPHEGSSWVTPSYQATAYYLDPRTYLNKNMNLIGGVNEYKDIFVFEDARAYTYQNDAIINQMLYYGKITGGFDTPYGYKTYRESFTDGSNFSKISPLMLISRSRNETGNYKSGSVSGHYVNTDTNTSYAGLYNFFNVGAYGAYPVTNGLIYARNAGWTDPYKAISEGSIFIGTKYIYNGQENQYFQKFNVSPYTLTSVYGHQYQTNIEAPITEANYVFWGYYDSGNINQPIVFHIPVYNNMPDTPTPRPVEGNPNNWLSNIKIDGEYIANFDGDNYYSYNNNWDDAEDGIFEQNVYSYMVAWNIDTINIEVEKANDLARAEGIGNIKIDKTQIIYIKVYAQNNTTKTYAIRIIKQEAPLLDEEGVPLYPEITDVLNNVGIKYNDNYLSGLDLGTSYQTLIDAITNENNLVSVAITKNPNNKTESFATGDVIKIKSGDNEISLSYVLYGDTNGDGKIDLFDLVDCRNIILDISNLRGEYKEAADTNKNKVVDLYDLVDIRNTILGSQLLQR